MSTVAELGPCPWRLAFWPQGIAVACTLSVEEHVTEGEHMASLDGGVSVRWMEGAPGVFRIDPTKTVHNVEVTVLGVPEPITEDSITAAENRGAITPGDAQILRRAVADLPARPTFAGRVADLPDPNAYRPPAEDVLAVRKAAQDQFVAAALNETPNVADPPAYRSPFHRRNEGPCPERGMHIGPRTCSCPPAPEEDWSCPWRLQDATSGMALRCTLPLDAHVPCSGEHRVQSPGLSLTFKESWPGVYYDVADVPPHLRPERTERGFQHLPPVAGFHAGRPAGAVRVYESSAAFVPSVWVGAEAPADRNNPDGPTVEAVVHMPLAQAVQLAEQIMWLAQNHYQAPRETR
jgi:hypothetical protein